MSTWDATYEANPVGSSSLGQGDDQFRTLKTNISARLGKEHQFLTTENAKQGIHKAGSAMPFVSASEPLVRADGSGFETGYDEGRLWINTANGAFDLYALQEIDGAGNPTWKLVRTETIGRIASFPFTPAVEERWLPCDGRVITKSEADLNGDAGGYENLVTLIEAEIAGDTTHPLYNAATDSVAVPDLRGASIRCVDNFLDAVMGSADKDSEGTRKTGHYQADKVLEHGHDYPHSHTLSDAGEHSHTIEGRNAGIGAVTGIESAQGESIEVREPTSTEPDHTHTVDEQSEDFTGTAKNLATEADDVAASENLVKNVALRYFIKY
jgi:hypothetical protein